MVDPVRNELLHRTLEPTITTVLAHRIFAELRENHRVIDVVILVDADTPLKDACRRHGPEFKLEEHGTRISVERVFRAVERRTTSLTNCFSNVDAETDDRWV